MGNIFTAMISSTARDLPVHRKEVMDACLQQGIFPVMMEHLPAKDEDAIEASLGMVDECDIYIGVYAWRYGYRPAGHDTSITEMEYNRAVERDIPRLIFLMHEDHPIKAADVEKGPGAEKLDAFKQRVGTERVANFFRSPEDLRAQVVNSLASFVQSGNLDTKTQQQAFAGHKAELRYRELALESCDIVDLANLPESDRHIAAKHLELRRLYVSLRVWVESPAGVDEEATLQAVEQRRQVALSDQNKTRQRQVRERVSVGERLAAAGRLVVLGDPGSGKSTLVRWIATAYLLRVGQDKDWQAVPDVETLPDKNWLPVMIRCRDLDTAALSGSFEDILRCTLRKAEMTSNEVESLQVVIQQKLKNGEALLLLDGLDEITNPNLRAQFSQQIERICIAYPQTSVIATSRIVGYREMGYRLGRGFEHVTIADLTEDDKDSFVKRWCQLTEPPERYDRSVAELIADIHSTDRIERLTGNPMMLTTMALVKRKVGKLPTRRADLYSESMRVLLSWRREVDTPIDDREAIPQLEYIAYAMCERGVQQLVEDEIVDLLEQMRGEFSNIHALRNHTPEEFLRLLEGRTGILVEAGHSRYRGRLTPVYEFRHLTFQEYLAALALIDGRIPNRDRNKPLIDYVAPLAGRVSEVKPPQMADGRIEVVVIENWRETLRLYIASCDDDKVEDALLAILRPLADEESRLTARPRAVLAAMCLTDEPNVSSEVARSVFSEFVQHIDEWDGRGNIQTSADQAVVLLAGSHWADMMIEIMVKEFIRRNAPINVEYQGNIGGLCAVALAARAPKAGEVTR